MEVFTKISVDPDASPEIKAKAAALVKYLQSVAPESEKIVVRGLEDKELER